MAGYVTRGKRGLDVIWEWTGFLLSYGGRYFDDQGKPAFNSPEGIAATEMFVKLLTEAGPEGTMNWSWMEANQNFAQEKSAMYVEAAGLGPVMEKKENPVFGKIGYTTLPAVDGKPTIPNYWFWMFGMPTGGKQKDCAFLFTEWATSKTLGIPLSMGGSSRPARRFGTRRKSPPGRNRTGPRPRSLRFSRCSRSWSPTTARIILRSWMRFPQR